MIVILDHYDSFTWNLVHLLAGDGAPYRVLRADRTSVEEVLTLEPTHLVLSPGPGTPGARGITLELIEKAPPELPILGVCLGHQALGVAYVARLALAPETVHGRTSMVDHGGTGLWRDIETPALVMRYHSWALSRRDWPQSLLIEASTRDSDECIMAIRHRSLPRFGIQFHPESYRTPLGPRMIRNFLHGSYS